MKQIEILYKDNKAFQKELDQSLITRLDKHKSDIQLEIRNEGKQIQRSLESSLNNTSIKLEKKISESFDVYMKELKLVKYLAFGLILIGLILLYGVFK